MSINPNKWTHKTQEAVAAAVDQAKSLSNPELTPDHVMAAIVRQEDTIVPAVLAKLGTRPTKRWRNSRRPTAVTNRG